MKVLYVTYGDLLGNVYESQLEPLWGELRQLGVDLSVLSFVGPSVLFKGHLRRRLYARIQSSPVTLKASYLGAGFLPRWPDRCAAKIRSVLAASGAEVVHARGPVAAGLCARAIQGRAGSPRLVFDMRGDTLAEIKHGKFLTGDLTKIENEVRVYETSALNQAARLLAVSNPLIELAQRRYGYRGPATMIPCWAQHPPGYEAPSETLRREVREELGVPSEAFVFAYCGSAASWQAVPEMMRLFHELSKKIPQSRFLIITDEAQAMDRQMRTMGLSPDRVVGFAGPRKDVLRGLSAADAAVLLREKNAINRVACPMKLGDYLLAGLPVLATDDIGDVSSWLRDEGAGEIAPSLDPGELLRAALALHDKVQTQAPGTLRKKTLDLFEKKLSLKAYLPKYLDAYAP